jgi:hypothetical protein
MNEFLSMIIKKNIINKYYVDFVFFLFKISSFSNKTPSFFVWLGYLFFLPMIFFLVAIYFIFQQHFPLPKIIFYLFFLYLSVYSFIMSIDSKTATEKYLNYYGIEDI